MKPKLIATTEETYRSSILAENNAKPVSTTATNITKAGKRKRSHNQNLSTKPFIHFLSPLNTTLTTQNAKSITRISKPLIVGI